MTLVDTASLPVVTSGDKPDAVRKCATTGCTNEGPLAMANVALSAFPDVPSWRADGRCRACVECIDRHLDPLSWGDSPADWVVRRVLGMPVDLLRLAVY